ncbi:MAG: GAF domain-containing protein [Kingella sp. (in: b-proteobacteria)]
MSHDGDLPIAVLANVCAALKMQFDWFWIGFYLVDDKKENLTLAPFQGPIACTRIAKGRGVCGQAWVERKTIVVPDVNQHPDHIACSSQSQSEIVIPIFDATGQVWAVLDIDHTQIATFDEIDTQYLRQIGDIISNVIFQAA